jgi:hypothetical protein
MRRDTTGKLQVSSSPTWTICARITFQTSRHVSERPGKPSESRAAPEDGRRPAKVFLDLPIAHACDFTASRNLSTRPRSACFWPLITVLLRFCAFGTSRSRPKSQGTSQRSHSIGGEFHECNAIETAHEVFREPSVPPNTGHDIRRQVMY